MFSREELVQIAALCQEFDALCLTDEIYEHILYDGAVHVPMMTLPGMRDRTVLVNSMSKTYSVTGWRVGWVLAAPEISSSVRKVHDFLTVGAAAPLQQAGVAALSLPDAYYQELAGHYQRRRSLLTAALERCGFSLSRPRGAYYVMASADSLGYSDDLLLSSHLIEKIGVAAVPGSSFFYRKSLGRRFIRFCFCKKYETLEEAGRLLNEAFGDARNA